MNNIISQPIHIKKYYQDEDVVNNYLSTRFNDPINKIEHKRQVYLLNKIIKDNNCVSLLEFGCGGGRITNELNAENGISVDSSAIMLSLAQENIEKLGKKWRFVNKDIFELNPMDLLPNKDFDLIFSFRFFLHFEKEDRNKLLKKSYSLLQKDGLLVFEAMNEKTVLPIRNFLGKNKYFIYDKLYTKNELTSELEENGFKIIKLYPILKHFWLQSLFSRPFKWLKMDKLSQKIVYLLEILPTQNPYEWVVVAQKQ